MAMASATQRKTSVQMVSSRQTIVEARQEPTVSMVTMVWMG
jgi:hypothetical protein